MAYPKHSEACCCVASRRNQIISGFGGRNGIIEKLLTMCMFVTAAVTPERKNENVS